MTTQGPLGIVAGNRHTPQPAVPQRRLPNLFIIGAMKSATSSLHDYLDRHPRLFMSRFKEPQFFAPHRTPQGYRWGQGQPAPEPGDGWYFRLFDHAGDVDYAGESSTAYTRRPRIEGAAERIHAHCPDARLIYVMRDPVERSISHYRYNVANRIEGRPILTALRRDPVYVDHSRYDLQLEPYLRTFGRERLFLVAMERLLAEPGEVTRELCRWLGINPDIDLGPFPASNATTRPDRVLRPSCHALAAWARHRRVRALGQRLPPVTRRWMERAATRPVVPMDVAEKQRAIAYLRQQLTPSVARLRDAVAFDDSGWTHFPRRLTADTAARQAA